MLIEFDNTIALVKPASDGELEMYAKVRDQIKTMAPGAKYMHNHKLYLRTGGKHGWDGKTSILSKPHPGNKSAFFPTGLLPYVYEQLMSKMPKEIISFTDLRAKPTGQIGSFTVPLYDYQRVAYDSAMYNTVTMGGVPFDWPCGVLKIATGGGKTELAVAIFEANLVPTVFVVHRKHLMSQAIERFAEYGVTAGQVGDSVFDPNPNGISVATIQTLHNRLKEGDMSKINQFIRAGQIFFDEAHLCASKLDKGNQFIQLSRQFRHAYYRWGLTATPFMKDEYSNQLLQGATGDLLCDISNDQLIKAGHLTPPRVVIIDMLPLGGPKKWPEVYESSIIWNKMRNDRIIEELEKCPKPAFVMCTRLQHASMLHTMAETKGISLPAVQHGNTSLKDRNKVLADLRSSKEKAIICSTIYDDGVDIPDLRTIILAGGGKSKVAALQRIGRGLRKAAGKHEVLVIDFNDQTGAILKRHSKARRKVWEDEGFKIEETA
jgi:superfamily II DNA or RNA helicase